MATRSLSKLFGVVLRAHRTGKGLTQEQLAERAGVHPTYIGMVERGERNCSLDIAASIASALESSLADLVKEAEIERAKGAKPASRKAKGS